MSLVEILVEMLLGAGRGRRRGRPGARPRSAGPSAPPCQLQPCANASVTAYLVRDDLPWAWVCRGHRDALTEDDGLRASLIPSSR